MLAVRAGASAPFIPHEAGDRLAIECRNVTVRFVTDRRTVTALENVSFSVEQGGFLSLLGPSVVPAVSGPTATMCRSRPTSGERRTST